MKINGWKKSPQNGMGKHVDKAKSQENTKALRKEKRKMKAEKSGTEKKQIFKKLGKLKKRTIIIIVISVTVTILGVVAAVIFFWPSNGSKGPNFSFGNRTGGNNQFTMSGDMVTASGVTSVGVTAESFDVENLTAGLDIVEVYVNSEEVITKGSKILKLSEESIAEARAELEQNLKEADLAYRAGVIEYEQSKISAEYDRDSTLLSGEQAKAVYDETLSGLTTSVERAKEELEQAKADIAEYRSYVNDASYKSYFKVDEYQAIYDKTLNALMTKMEEWGVSWPQVTGQGSGGSSGGGFAGDAVYNPDSGNGTSGSEGVESAGPTSDQIKVLAALYDVLELQRKDLDQAESDYQQAVANASFELQTLELQLPELENTLAEAEKNYKNQILQAELTYQTALTNAQSAESDYETAIEQAETTYRSLEKTYEDAKENLELFESSVGDGYFYASGNGTILRSMVRAGQKLSSESTILMYSNPEEMTVSVSVDQSDIASIVVDDSVYIQSSEFGGFEGVVTEVNPISNSDSRTNVTYTVTVQFSGGESGIGANESVSVVFGMDSETIQSMTSMPQGFGSGQMPEGFDASQMPQGFGSGQMPEGFDASQMPQGFGSGQMPEGFTPGQMPSGGFGNGSKGNRQ